MTTVADLIVETLEQAGVERIYGVVGDSLNGLTESLRTRETIKWVHVRHEEAAAFAASGESQLTGKLAVCAGSCGACAGNDREYEQEQGRKSRSVERGGGRAGGVHADIDGRIFARRAAVGPKKGGQSRYLGHLAAHCQMQFPSPCKKDVKIFEAIGPGRSRHPAGHYSSRSKRIQLDRP